jgi:hypothetical protein
MVVAEAGVPQRSATRPRLARGGLLPGSIDTQFEQRPLASEPDAKKRFCSRCGEPAVDPPASEPPPFEQRVCAACGMGVLLRCAAGALPGAGSAFLIVDRALGIAAVSEGAEAIFGSEEALIGKLELLDLLTSTIGDRKLARTVGQAALRVHGPLTVPVRLSGDRADEIGTMACRVSTCGPPRAALLSVEPTHFGRR